jgi:uncharacterized protein (TIGR03118 family)
MKIIMKAAIVSVLVAFPSLNSALGQSLLVDPRTAVTATMDGGTTKVNNTWYELGVNVAAPTTGLPTGLVHGQTDTNSTYQIQPAVGMNAFLLDAANPAGTITLETPVALHGFSFAGSDGNGSAIVALTLHFTDGSSDTLPPVTFGDWFGNTPIVYTTDGRVSVSPPNSFQNVGTSSNNPRVLANNVTNSTADAAKMLASISFAWKEATGSSGTHTCIFGLSGDATGTGHYSPITLTPDSYNQDMIVGVAEVSHNAYVQQNLVSDLAGVAPVVDTNLVNPWGIVASSSSPFWVSDNRTGLSTLYNSTGAVQALVVIVPPPAGSTAHSTPTGIIFNSTTNFVVPVNTSNAPAHFIFATEDGTISAWASGADALLEVDNSAQKAVYKGLALASIGASNYLYAANFRAGTIDVFDSNFKPVTNGPPLTTKGVPFTDTNVPADFAPFNVQTIGTNLYVTYAMQDTNKFADVPGPGNGFVDVFDTTGNLLQRFAAHGLLDSPWGLALAPASYGSFGGALLVGNFGDGRINAFDATLGTSLGPLLGTNGTPIDNVGLWGLIFGNGGKGGDTNTLYFTAGIPGTNGVQSHGLLGAIAFEASQSVGVPWELLQTVNGYQDNFDTTNLNSNWVAVAQNDPSPDQYQQVAGVGDGVLRVFPTIGDPNHLLYMLPGYSNDVQEVLARIRVVGFQTNSDGPRGGLAIGVTTNTVNPSRGIDLHFRDYAKDSNDNNQSQRKFKLLYDGVSWGPQGLEVNGTEIGWTNNVWYWMRLRQDPGANGTNDVFAKVWPSDGVTPEPTDWQMVWGYVPAHPPLSTGFAGIAGASNNGFGQTEVNYILIKAAGLPSIVPSFGVFGQPPNLPVFTGITHTNNAVTVDWFGGSYLLSAGDVLGPWSLVPYPTNAPYSPFTVTGPTGQNFYRIQR